MVDLGIKSAVKDWMNQKYENWIKKPVERKTLELESFVRQQVDKVSQIASTHSQKAKATAYKPVDYYWKQEDFYRGLFWIAVLALIVLWIISGS